MKRLAPILAVSVALLFCLGPFAWQLATSLHADTDAAAWPQTYSLSHYAYVISTPAFVRALANSALVAGLTTLICLSVGASAAFALAKLPFRGKRILLFAALTASMFPPIATVSPLYLATRALGMRDTPYGLIFPYVTFALPLTLWILTSFFREIPDELYRAARVDGCTPFGAFVRVLLPLAAPGLATTGILVFIAAWNEFLYALTFTSSPDQRTVPVAISLLASEHKEPWGEIAAASILATMPLVIVTALLQRRIVQGLTAGAVKG